MTAEQIPTSSLVVDATNVRVVGDSDLDVSELAASIADQGVLNPLLVRPLPDGRFGVIAGQRRLAAARAAGLDEVPCQVRELDDTGAAVASATENLARVNLDPITEAETYQVLLRVTGATQTDLAGRLGVAASTMSARLQLLELPEDLREAVRDGDMSVKAAKQMVGKVRRAKATPRGPAPARPRHTIGSDNVDMLDAVVVDVYTLARIRRAIDGNVDDVPAFVARALARELVDPSCHARNCHAPVTGASRFCGDHVQQLRQIRTELERRWKQKVRADGKKLTANTGREISDRAARRAADLLVHGPDNDTATAAQLEVVHG